MLYTQLRHTPRSAHLPLAMDAVSKEDVLELTFDVPGVREEDLEVTIERNVLTISANRDAQATESTVLVGERQRGTIRRQLNLSDGLDTSSVTAALRDGVLTLSIPVAETAKPQKIEVTVQPELEVGTPDNN